MASFLQVCRRVHSVPKPKGPLLAMLNANNPEHFLQHFAALEKEKRLTPDHVLLAFERISKFPNDAVSRLNISPISFVLRENCAHLAALQITQALKTSQRLNLTDPLFYISLFSQISSRRFHDISDQLLVLDALLDNRFADQKFLLSLAGRLFRHIPDLTPVQVVVVTNIFSKLKVNDVVATSALGERTRVCVRDFTHTQIAELLAAWLHWGVESPVIAYLCLAIDKFYDRLSIAQIVLVCEVVGACSVTEELLAVFTHLCVILSTKLHDLTSAQLITVLASVAQFRPIVDDFTTGLCELLAQRVREFSPKDICIIFSALKDLDLGQSNLSPILLAHASTLPAASACYSVGLLEELTRLQERGYSGKELAPKAFALSLVQHLPSKGPFQAREIATVLRALWKFDLFPNNVPLAMSLCEIALALPNDEFTLKECSSILISLASGNILNGRLNEKFFRMINSRASSPEIGLEILCAYVRFLKADRALLCSLGARALVLLSRLSVDEVVFTLHAFCVLSYFPRDVFNESRKFLKTCDASMYSNTSRVLIDELNLALRLEQPAWEPFPNFEPAPDSSALSAFHGQVTRTLRRLGLEHANRHSLGGLVVDVIVEQNTERSVVLELQGASHRFAQTDQLPGQTSFRRRLLTKMGLPVVAISDAQWPRKEAVQEDFLLDALRWQSEPVPVPARDDSRFHKDFMLGYAVAP